MNVKDPEKKEKNIYEKRFELLMKLIRINNMLKGAKIIHVSK